MGARQVAALAAALIASTPSFALEPQDGVTTPGTMFYVSIPLGATTAKQQAPSYGLAFQGRRQYETVNVDSRQIRNFADALGGIETKWLIAGGVVIAAGAAVALKNKDRSDNYNNNQNNQQAQQPPCPDPSNPCPK